MKMNCIFEAPMCKLFQSTNLTANEVTPVTTLKISVLIFSVLFGLPTHSYIIWLIITGAGNGVALEFFILNLSVCEIIFSLYSLLYVPALMIPSLQNHLFLILLLRFLTGDIVIIRPVFQCLICVERYLAVVHPVTFLKFRPLRYRVICSAVVWIAGLGICALITVVTFNIYIWISFLQFFLFFSIQLFCCVAVLRALKQSGPGERVREREEENHMKRRAFHLILVMTVTTLILFGPFITSKFIYIVTQGDILIINLFSLYCLVLGGVVPALLYLRRTRKLPFIKPQ